MTPDARERARAVRLMIFDVDGVMTDGRLYFSNSGEEMKSFHTLDGQGVKMLKESGVEVALLTARQSQIVTRRAAELGITHVRQGASEKAGYAGDDLVDLPVLMRCGFAASVPEAPEAIRGRVHYVTRAGGGAGAVRELCEFIMESQGSLEAAIARFLHP